MPNRVLAVGVGMTKFEKPGSSEGWGYPQLAHGVNDHGARPRRREFSAAELGMTRISTVNVNVSLGGAAAVTAYQKVDR